jgi:S-DNA-T family DNA segregation ATPase FtsK/SpoIIIE
MHKELHFQADRIELVLASHKVPGRVTGGKVTPRLVRYQITTPLGVKVKQVAGLAEELALSLGAPSCRVYREDGRVQVEVPRREGQVVGLGEVCQRLASMPGQGQGRRGCRVPPVTAVLGLDGEGVPLLLRLPSRNVAHVLLAGTTGSGKTALARTMVASLARYNSQRQVQMVLVDPKSRGLMAFEGLPHLLEPVVTCVEGAVAVLALP